MARVLFAPRNISGQSTEMLEAVRLFGYDGEVWSFGDPVFGFGADRVLDPGKLVADPGYRWDVLDQAIRDFDVFHFQYGRSLLEPIGVTIPDLWDLPLLKSLDKRVFMHFRGSDVRLKSMHLEREPDSYFREADIPSDEPRILGKLSIVRRFCDAMFVSTPGLLDYVPDGFWIPHVIDVSAWAADDRPPRDTPVVVHIPSSRGTKGSDTVDEVLTDLHRQGVCEYRALRGLDRSELRRALQDADMVVDSIGIGDHGLISVEAMASGAVALAHIHERNRERNPGVPVVEVTGATLGAVVSELAADPERRAELRAQGIEWVRRRHDRPVVGRMLADFYDKPPVVPTLSYPDWPRSDSRRRMEKIEAELEKLRTRVPAAVDPGRGAGALPGFVADRLSRRIAELEAALAQTDPESPLLKQPVLVGVGKVRLRRGQLRPRKRLKAFILRHERLHRMVRRVRGALPR